MNKKTLLLLPCITYALLSCNHSPTGGSAMTALDNDTSFPSVKILSSSATTVFVPTMEHTLSANKNVIYSPAFLYAWDELRAKLDGTIKIPANNADLQLINSSTSYKGSLSPDEYATEVTEYGNSVKVQAAFKKGLPFKNDMDTSHAESPFLFKDVRVKAFGMPSFSKKIAERISILYYENDDKFIIKLLPANEQEEIILAKGMDIAGTLTDLLQQVNRLTDSGQKVVAKDGGNWKYNLLYNDEVLIPTMRFNYKANFNTLINAMISASGHTFRIDTASERNAFIIDEHGAKVESKAEIFTTAAATPLKQGDTVRHPKKLFFNKDFVLLLRKKAAPYPYFMIAVNNTDIMERR